MSATTLALNRNAMYLKQQFSALMHNTSPVITLICLITIFGYLLSFSESAVWALSVTPGYILPNGEFWIWTAFTFCFIELHWWEVMVDVVTVGLCGKMLEPLWGQVEMFKFFALTNFGVSILTTCYYLLYYSVTKNPQILFEVHIHGLAGYVAGICVAVRQIMPDHLIFKTRYGKLTNRNVPLAVLVGAIIMWALHLLDGTFPAMFVSGLLVSWTYLRFYQRHTNGRGDSSESFTFISFFPLVMQPFINVLTTPIYNMCLRVGTIKPPAPPRSISNASLTSVSVMMTGDPHDIERRRQIALKALSERLKTTDNSKHSQLPKSFPPSTAVASSGDGSHSHGHGHGHGHSHSHGHHHQHHQHHSHQHQQQNQNHAHALEQMSATAPFLATGIPNAVSTAPITTARAEPRMISTMSPIAIPMPAPPPKSSSTSDVKLLVDIEAQPTS